MKLLWVENQARFARIAGREFLGDHEVSLVSSLAQARLMLRAHRFDGVLLDFDLDDGVGSDLMLDIQHLNPRPFVVAASAHQAGNDALRAAGADVSCLKADWARLGATLDDLKDDLKRARG